jgi:protein-tyrosine phosphatase
VNWSPDLDWLAADLAIGGSFPMAHAEILAREHAIAAVIDLRVEACDEPEVLAACGMELLHLPTQDLAAVAPDMLDEGVGFARRAKAEGRRLLVHCEHGIGRSATLALCVLVDRGMDPLAALAHAKARRAKLSPSPAQYQAWARWLRRRRLPPAPPFEAFAAIAYRHLAGV